MEISIENQGEIERKITISVPSKVFDSSVHQHLMRYARNAKIPGFRKGKVPQKMLERQFGGAALKEAIDALINEYYPRALQQEEILPASLLKIEPTQVERGKDFIFDVAIEVYPEIGTPTLEGETIEQVEVVVKDEDIDRTLESIRKRRTEYSPVDRPASEGDQLLIDFSGSIDGEAFSGGKGEDTELVLGEGRFMKPFEDKLAGAGKGDERVFNIDFPEDYHGPEVAGKTAEFTVSVKEVREGKLPELDEDFARTMGVEGGIDGMRDEVRIGLEREMLSKLRGSNRDQVFKAISDKYDFPLPRGPVEEEIERAMTEVRRQLEQQGINDQSAVKREAYEAPSRQRVKLGLLVRAIVEAEGMEPDQDRVEARIKEIAGSYAEPEQFTNYIRSDEQQMNQITGVILEEQVVDHLLAGARVKKLEKSYEEFMASE